MGATQVTKTQLTTLWDSRRESGAVSTIEKSQVVALSLSELLDSPDEQVGRLTARNLGFVR